MSSKPAKATVKSAAECTTKSTTSAVSSSSSGTLDDDNFVGSGAVAAAEAAATAAAESAPESASAKATAVGLDEECWSCRVRLDATAAKVHSGAETCAVARSRSKAGIYV